VRAGVETIEAEIRRVRADPPPEYLPGYRELVEEED
jgi:hypothetical protein